MLLRFLFIFVLFLSSCDDGEVSVTDYIRSVRTEPLREVLSLKIREISGVVTTSGESKMSFRVSGRVNEIFVQNGDLVSKGMVLATLDKDEYELSVASAKAKLSGALASYSEKEKHLFRQKSLLKDEYVSKAVVEQAEADFKTAKSNVLVAKSALQIAQNDLKSIVLRAPFDGRIVSRNIEPFSEISVSNIAFVLQNQDTYNVEVLIPETFIHLVDYNDKVSVSFPSFPEQSISGSVSQISAKAESGNAFLLKVSLDKTKLPVLAGLTAKVAFSFSRNSLSSGTKNNASLEKTYLIPIKALDVRIEELAKNADKEIGVFVFNETKQIAEARKVKIIALRNNHLEVTGNIKEGELLITAGVSFIKDGQKLKKWQPTYNVSAKIKL